MVEAAERGDLEKVALAMGLGVDPDGPRDEVKASGGRRS